MTEPFGGNRRWLAQRNGQDWRDDDIFAAINWLTSLLPTEQWRMREAATDAYFQRAKTEWISGNRVALFDPKDAVAWYLHQAKRYADPVLRHDFFFPEGFRIAPIFRRLGQLIPTFRGVAGAEERAARLMSHNLSQPDDGIYELLVAAAYAKRGWTNVAFVPEVRGGGKTPDLLVDRNRSHWAVECKRTGRSGYARDERLAGESMADEVHKISKTCQRPLVVVARFKEELHLLGSDYLAQKAVTFMGQMRPLTWSDDGGEGMILDVNWFDLHSVLQYDDLYFGGSLMVKLLIGSYNPVMDFSFGGAWTPAEDRPFHATSVEHVSLVVWRSASQEAARRKAVHFRGLVANAAKQLPGDRPGVVHVGYEAVNGNSEDRQRNRLNREQMRTFEPGTSNLRLVYGNYFMNEQVTARNESAAVSETTALYPVGKSSTTGPLPKHLLFRDDSGLPGYHF